MDGLHGESARVHFEEVADLHNGGGGAEPNRVLDKLIEVKVRRGLQRTPDLFQSAREIEPVEHVDAGSFQGCHANIQTEPVYDTDAHPVIMIERRGHADRLERERPHFGRAARGPGEVLVLLEDAVGIPMEFEGRVVCEHRVGSHAGGDQVRIDGSRRRIAARWNGHVEAASEPDDAASRLMMGQNGLPGRPVAEPICR